MSCFCVAPFSLSGWLESFGILKIFPSLCFDGMYSNNNQLLRSTLINWCIVVEENSKKENSKCIWNVHWRCCTYTMYNAIFFSINTLHETTVGRKLKLFIPVSYLLLTPHRQGFFSCFTQGTGTSVYFICSVCLAFTTVGLSSLRSL